MASNQALARRARDILCAALRVTQPAPDSMLGSMAAVPLVGVGGHRRRRAPPEGALRRRAHRGADLSLAGRRGARHPGEAARGILVRVSAQRYNRADEYERLADTLVARLAEKKRRR